MYSLFIYQFAMEMAQRYYNIMNGDFIANHSYLKLSPGDPKIHRHSPPCYVQPLEQDNHSNLSWVV